MFIWDNFMETQLSPFAEDLPSDRHAHRREQFLRYPTGGHIEYEVKVGSRYRLFWRSTFIAFMLVFGWLSIARAHPMGNFAICHYARIQPFARSIDIRYVLDFAEIPTVSEKETMDKNRDGKVSKDETAEYLHQRSIQWVKGLSLSVNGNPAPLEVIGSDLEFSTGAGNLQTLKVTMVLRTTVVSLPRYTVDFEDTNYKPRVGWKEIIVNPGTGVSVVDSTAPSKDRSRELTVYPLGGTPAQLTRVKFTVVAGGSSADPTTVISQGTTAPSRNDSTPRDAFTEAISQKRLTPGTMLLGLTLAFIFGCFHALSPGHGKTMVAAYLVGSRGTPKHAVLLGLVVTITHTFGVFMLGLVTLFASKYVLPEKLYPILSMVSGLAVLGVGVWLLWSRMRGLPDHHHHHHGDENTHDHHTHEHAETAEPHSHGDHWHDADGNTHYYAETHQEHDHPHDHEAAHVHDHAEGHGHSHGFGHHHHHHVPDGPITAKALIALGISGGIVPCPSALVVLLSAIALHRLLYGMALITAFSFGLAAVLIVIGILVVSARDLLNRLPSSGKVMERLPVLSAGVITLIGMVLVYRAAITGQP